jgi:hypothetical protein
VQSIWKTQWYNCTSMPPLIVDMPWPPDAGENLRDASGQPLICPTTSRPMRVFHDQIIVWGSLTPLPAASPPMGFPVFPIVIDTGFNNAFLMQQRQTEVWTPPGVFAQFFTNGLSLPIGRDRIPFWDAALWVYPNIPGTCDPDLASRPAWLDLPHGIAFTPSGSAFAKEKPLLGMRAIRFNRLQLRIDGQTQRVWIDTP